MSLRVRELDEAVVRRLANALGVRGATARCLMGRGVAEPGTAKAYLEPRLGGLRKPDGLAGFALAVERIAEAVVRGEQIGIFGDYDVDGVTTAALLGTFLRSVGPAVSPIVKVARRDAGYGFGEADAAGFAAQGCRVVITGDCGTSDLVAVAAARAAGMDVIVVDHHTVPAAGVRHPATVLVNPFRHDSTFPFRGLASVGLAFYLVAAIRTRLDERGWFRAVAKPDVRDLLDLVALGTIADLVPLQGENRILARAGLAQLVAKPRPGVLALLRSSGLLDSERTPTVRIDEKAIAWKLAPRLNAPGRLGDADPSLRLLLADATEADACAAVLEEANTTRRGLQDRVLEDALGMLDGKDPGPAVVVSGRGWPAGVVGIVAAKLVDLYARPAFVIAVDPETGTGRGSARTAGGIDLYRALGACEPLLAKWGGHAAAAGLTIDEAHIDALREQLGAAVTAQGGVGAVDDACDAEVLLEEVDERLCAELGTLAPFGQGNEAPSLVTRGVVVTTSRRVGDGSHLKLEVEHRGAVRGGILFGFGDAETPAPGARLDLAFTPVASSWQGRRRVELEVSSLLPSC